MQLFDKARVKLTFWYLAIIAFISFSFSFIIYRLQTQELSRFESLQRERIETRIEQGMGLYQVGPRRSFIYLDTELIEGVKKRILMTLGIFNGSVLFVAGIASYILAGRTLAPIKEMLDEQERFTADASHELRTPLTVLRTTLEVYARSKTKSVVGADSVIEKSLTEVIRLQKLSDYLLELSRGKVKLAREKIDLKVVVDQAVSNILPLITKKKLQLVNKVVSTNVLADSTSLEQLISILLDNAVKYTNKDGKIIISIEQARRKVMLKIKDTGVGISKDDLPHIFDRFYRSDTSRSKGGYGLGLAIAKNIAECHNGTLTANSKLGVGTTFTLKLPLK